MFYIDDIWHYAVYENVDTRTKDWWLVSSPWTVLTILGSYLVFCVYLGPAFMKNRQPYKLKDVLAVYNLFQVLFSIYLVANAVRYAFVVNFSFFNFKCDWIDFTDNGNQWASGIWWWYMSKYTELLDTVLFVLRKKSNQVTFLHLYHHTTMPIIAWWTTKYAAGGQGIVEGGLNSFIHVFMYTYYLVSGLGPQYQKYLWWKKYLTLMQLVQFCVITYLNIKGLLLPNCNYPKALNLVVIFNCILFFYMFGKFYISSYTKKAKQK